MGNVKNKGLRYRIRKKILERDGYKCNICGHNYLQIHISKNGDLRPHSRPFFCETKGENTEAGLGYRDGLCG